MVERKAEMEMLALALPRVEGLQEDLKMMKREAKNRLLHPLNPQVMTAKVVMLAAEALMGRRSSQGRQA